MQGLNSETGEHSQNSSWSVWAFKKVYKNMFKNTGLSKLCELLEYSQTLQCTKIMYTLYFSGANARVILLTTHMSHSNFHSN